jgi:acetyltransferase-like isoleucine patch superfamily enzyme
MFLIGVKSIFIGNNVRVFPGIRLEVHNNGKIIIESNVSIAQNVHITCSDIPLIIGEGTVIAANSFITNIDHNFENLDKPILKQGIRVSKTLIGKNCFIGMGAAINAGSVIEDNVIVGANGVVKGHINKGVVVAANKASMIKKYDFKLKKWVRI